MPDIHGTTRAQTLFLRAFRSSTTGPGPDKWPAPAILRKWLRKPAFKRALQSVQDALRFQTDFHLAASATQAIQQLAAGGHDSPPAAHTIRKLSELLRLAHLRQRFTPLGHTPDGDDDDDDNRDNARPPRKPSIDLSKIPQRAPDPLWVTDKALLAKVAFREGYVAPLRQCPHFPDPVPQDTFYHQLVQSPQMLLWYMYLYEKSGNDHRFQPILSYCKPLVPTQAPGDTLPHFQSQPQPATIPPIAGSNQ